ncbi:MAG: hypothetical protein FD153_1272 [Rhodospirillaceae bacterium]|nr:MAG: hypothetical protein FD153_1272 [Rhodospirillaceae bacterium]
MTHPPSISWSWPVPGEKGTPCDNAAVLYLTGRSNELTGAFDAALTNYDAAANSGNRSYQGQARMAQTEPQLRLGLEGIRKSCLP